MNFWMWVVLMLASIGYYLYLLVQIHDFWVYRHCHVRRADGRQQAFRRVFAISSIFLLIGLFADPRPAVFGLVLLNILMVLLSIVFYIWSQRPSPEERNE